MTAAMPHVDGVEHRYVDLGGLRLHVAEAGEGDPLMLVHGWPQHWFMWRKLIRPLARRYRVICPDLRGFGWSDAPGGRYEKKTLARDLVRLLDALGLERVRMVGHDWGGFAAFLACLERPDRFERLAALSIVSPWYRSASLATVLTVLAYQGVIAAPFLGRRVAAMPVFTRQMLKGGSGAPYTDEELAAYTEVLRDPARARATVALYRSFQLIELPAIAAGRYVDGRLTVPALGVYGEHDPVIREGGLESARPHADSMRVERLAGAAHFIPEEAPNEVLSLLEPFLA